MSHERLEEALRAVGDDYLRQHPADLHRARARVGRLRRRNQMRAGAVTALGVAAVVAVAVVAWPGSGAGPAEQRPAAPVDLPAGAISVEVGDSPAEVAVGDGAIWVSNSGDSTVSRVDPETNEEALSVYLSGRPGDLAVGAGGEVWVASPDLGAVQRIDPVTSSITPDRRIDVGDEAPLDLAIDDFLWVAVIERELVQVDPASGDVVRRLGWVRPVNVAARAGMVFALEADGTVRGIDQLTGDPTAVRLSFPVSGPGDIHYHDGKLWVAEGDGSNLYSVDVEGGSRRIRTYTFRGTYVEMVELPEGIVVLSDLGDGTGVLTLVEPETGGTSEITEIEGSPRDMARDGVEVWVSTSAADAVVRLPKLP